MADINGNEKAWDYYEKVKRALNGLFEILSINFDPSDLYYQCGVDNLEVLKDSIIDLLSNPYSSKEVKLKLRDIEFNIKKNLFFDESKKKEQKLT